MDPERAGADPDNYQAWGVTAEELVLRFAPYQVASYADGQQEVRIPYGKLKDLLAPKSPVAPILARQASIAR